MAQMNMITAILPMSFSIPSGLLISQSTRMAINAIEIESISKFFIDLPYKSA